MFGLCGRSVFDGARIIELQLLRSWHLQRIYGVDLMHKLRCGHLPNWRWPIRLHRLRCRQSIDFGWADSKQLPELRPGKVFRKWILAVHQLRDVHVSTQRRAIKLFALPRGHLRG